MGATVISPRTLYTIEELERFSGQGDRYELVEGELRPMPPTGGEHGRTTISLSASATVFAESHDLGLCFAAETGFLLSRAPDTVLAPDWAFVAKDRLPDPMPKGFVPVVPDLVLETRSPGDTQPQVDRKVQMWLNAGAGLVWELDPSRRTLTVYRPNQPPQPLSAADTLSGEDVLPGFALPLNKLLA